MSHDKQNDTYIFCITNADITLVWLLALTLLCFWERDSFSVFVWLGFWLGEGSATEAERLARPELEREWAACCRRAPTVGWVPPAPRDSELSDLQNLPKGF